MMLQSKYKVEDKEKLSKDCNCNGEQDKGKMSKVCKGNKGEYMLGRIVKGVSE